MPMSVKKGWRKIKQSERKRSPYVKRGNEEINDGKKRQKGREKKNIELVRDGVNMRMTVIPCIIRNMVDWSFKKTQQKAPAISMMHVINNNNSSSSSRADNRKKNIKYEVVS